MSALYAGLLCTLLLIGAIAALFGCMSAARCLRRSSFALCLAITGLDFAPLAALLSRLPACDALSPAPWTAAALPGIALSLWACFFLLRRPRRQLSPVSIKESCDHLPCALCFAWESGQPCLKNLKMDELSHLLTGEALLNANAFWEVIEPQPIATLSNGQTWSFERRQMEMSGRIVYQITGMNITEEARLRQELEKDNLRLQAMNRRLRQYGRDVQETTREKEILRAKTRVHDEIGRALLQTRQFLSGAQGDAETVCAAWRQAGNVPAARSTPANSVQNAAQSARQARRSIAATSAAGSHPTRRIRRNTARNAATRSMKTSAHKNNAPVLPPRQDLRLFFRKSSFPLRESVSRLLFKLHILRFHRNLLHAPAVSRQFFFILQERMIQRHPCDARDFLERQRQRAVLPLADVFPQRVVFAHCAPPFSV